jgi:hypothetical protein
MCLITDIEANVSLEGFNLKLLELKRNDQANICHEEYFFQFVVGKYPVLRERNCVPVWGRT